MSEAQVDYNVTMSGRVRPIAAVRAFLKLVEDKDDSANVVLFRTALDGDWYGPFYERFIADPSGQRLQARGACIFDQLSDESYLASLPEGSLGGLYYKELLADGVTPAGFREVDKGGQNYEHLPEDWRLAHYRRIDIHDLMHTLVGWGRDPLGEICIVRFQGVQWRSRGMRALSYLGGLEVKRRYPKTPAFACIREARRIGERMTSVVPFEWEAHLHRPIEDVRRDVGWCEPTVYCSVRDEWREIDREVKAQIAARKAAAKGASPKTASA